MPDLWDTNPEHVFSTPDEQPDPVPNDREDHPKEVGLRDGDGRGWQRLPAYFLIALVIAVVAILVVLAGLLFANS
jgi:hypothetical protein